MCAKKVRAKVVARTMVMCLSWLPKALLQDNVVRVLGLVAEGCWTLTVNSSLDHGDVETFRCIGKAYVESCKFEVEGAMDEIFVTIFDDALRPVAESSEGAGTDCEPLAGLSACYSSVRSVHKQSLGMIRRGGRVDMLQGRLLGRLLRTCRTRLTAPLENEEDPHPRSYSVCICNCIQHSQAWTPAEVLIGILQSLGLYIHPAAAQSNTIFLPWKATGALFFSFALFAASQLGCNGPESSLCFFSASSPLA